MFQTVFKTPTNCF